MNGTITRRARHMFEYTNNKQILLIYQDKSRKFNPIINAAKKVWIQEKDLLFLLVMNYETLLDYPDGQNP